MWAVPFYERLHEYYMQHETANSISYSLSRYAHTLTQFDVDTQYQLVAGAVAVLVKDFIKKSGTANSVQLAEQADRLLAERLLSSWEVRSKADHASLAGYAELLSLQAERALLASLDPEAGPLVADQLVAARKLFEFGAMSAHDKSAAGRPDLLSYYNRVQQLRRVYAVLLARAIGYKGPVSRFLTAALDEQAGWMRSEDTSAEIKQAAQHFYFIDEDLSGLTVWPRFAI